MFLYDSTESSRFENILNREKFSDVVTIWENFELFIRAWMVILKLLDSETRASVTMDRVQYVLLHAGPLEQVRIVLLFFLLTFTIQIHLLVKLHSRIHAEWALWRIKLCVYISWFVQSYYSPSSWCENMEEKSKIEQKSNYLYKKIVCVCIFFKTKYLNSNFRWKWNRRCLSTIEDICFLF